MQHHDGAPHHRAYVFDEQRKYVDSETGVELRIELDQALKNGSHFRAELFQRHVVLEAAKNEIPPLPELLFTHSRRAHGEPDVRLNLIEALPHRGKMKLRRQNADDGVGRFVHVDGFADHASIFREFPVEQGIADNGHRSTLAGRVGRSESTA